MKKIFALLAVVLGVVSCQTEPEGLDVNVGGEQEVAVCVSLPEATRAADSAEGAFKNLVGSDEYTIRYIFQVFYKGDESGAARQVIYSDGNTVSFPVRLVPGREYNFVAWADVVPQAGKTLDVLGVYNKESDYRYNTEDLEAVTFKGDWLAMDETFDAYTDAETITYYGTTSINLHLIRPFAKLRVMTTDMVELRNLDIVPEGVTVTYTVPVYKSFDVTAQAANTTDASVHTFTYNLSEVEKYTATETTSTLFTNYLFGAENGIVKFTMDVNDTTPELIKSNNFNTDIPVQRNYLTTISGNILTDGNNVTVTVENNGAFAGEKEWPDENNSSEQLAYAAMFGGEVTLTQDVVLTQPLEIVEGAIVVINLENQTLTGAIELAEGAELTVNNGTIVNTNNQISSITTNGDLTLNNVTIESARHGVRVESGNVVINGGVYKVVPISASTLHALNVGDDGTTANVVIKGGTFIGPKGTMADSGSAVNVRNGSSVVIEGGNFSGGKSKTLSGNITVKGGTFDQNPTNFVTAGYKAVKAGDFYYVLPEIIANAAETAGVTAVTESTADVATALATNNGEAALFMWNDVAYIAKYGEVIITSAADEATTVRGVVEYAAGLTSATVADGIEVVGNRTFRKCANLETVALPNTLTEIGPAVFQSCSKLANITIPESVTTIGGDAFAECSSLESINIPAGVTRIEENALRATGLVSVEFHEGVTYFGTQAFRDCKQLKEVIIKAPEFTVEANAFGVMGGTLPGTKIYVANEEMKAYLESTLAYKNQFTIIAPSPVSDTAGLQAALASDTKIVTVAAGDYTFPSSSVQAGQTIICEEGTVFTGTSGLNIKGATVIGAEFKNEVGNAVSGNINGTFKNCTFTGSNALRGCYAGETVVFENCVFSGNTYGVHFDGGANDATFKGCTFSGLNAFGAALTQLTLEDCTFVGNGKSGYNGANLWGSTAMKNCEFTFDGSVATEWIDCIGADKQYSFENCTINGVPYTVDNYASYLGYIWSRTDNITVKINGVDCDL